MFAAKDQSESDTESEQEEVSATKRYNLRSSTVNQVNMIILPDPKTENTRESIERFDTNADKEKAIVIDDDNVVKDEESIIKILKDENGKKIKEKRTDIEKMMNMMPNHTY